MTIAKMSGRAEFTIPVKSGWGVFAVVVEGAFEVQYRLLHERDAVAIWNVEEIAVEALSNDAIIVVVEMGGL